MYSELYNHPAQLYFTFHHSPKHLISVKQSSPLPLPSASGLLPVCVGGPVLDISYKWDYTLCDLSWLSPLQCIFKVSRVVACICTPFLFKAAQFSILWLYHIVFMRSSADGQSSFHLAVISSAAVNIGAQVCVWTWFPFPRVDKEFHLQGLYHHHHLRRKFRESHAGF